MAGEGEMQEGVDHVSESVSECRTCIFQVRRWYWYV